MGKKCGNYIKDSVNCRRGSGGRNLFDSIRSLYGCGGVRRRRRYPCNRLNPIRCGISCAILCTLLFSGIGLYGVVIIGLLLLILELIS